MKLSNPYNLDAAMIKREAALSHEERAKRKQRDREMFEQLNIPVTQRDPQPFKRAGGAGER